MLSGGKQDKIMNCTECLETVVKSVMPDNPLQVKAPDLTPTNYSLRN